MSGPCGGAARQDVLVAADVDTPSVGGKGSEAWVVYRRAKKQGDMKRKAQRAPRESKDKVKGDGQDLNGLNRRTRVRGGRS